MLEDSQIVILLSIASLLRATLADYFYLNQTCTSSEQCPGFQDGYSVQCQRAYMEGMPRCRCSQGYVADDNKRRCVSVAQKLGDRCTDDSQCEFELGAICELGICVCPSPFTLAINGSCQSILQYGYCRASVDGGCDVVEARDCGLNIVRQAVRQDHPTCYCGEQYDKQRGQGVMSCRPNGKKVGETCESYHECFNPVSQTYVECRNGKCVCLANTHEFQGKCYMSLQYGDNCFRGDRRLRRCYSLLPGSTENTVACNNNVCACTGDFHYHAYLKACRKVAGPKGPIAVGFFADIL